MRRLYALILCLSFAILIAPTSNAQSTPMPVSLSVPHRLQDTPVWCWVTAAQMVLEYRGMPPQIQQCQMLEYGYNLPEGFCCTDARRCMRTAQHMFEVQQLVRKVGGVPSYVSLAENPMSMYNHLLNDKPVIIEIATDPYSSHAVVAFGMRFEDRCGQQCQPNPYNPYGPPICMPVCQRFAFVAVNDPLRFDQYEIEYSQLYRMWKSSLVVM
jgi:hypothetical protein